jgi:hypothetical protein
MKMRTAMRLPAFVLAALFLTTHLGAEQEAPRRPQPMTPAEDARLASRAAHHPDLENFTAGQSDVQQAEAILLLIVGIPFAVFSVAVGQLIALPLGLTHSSQGRGFVPRDSLRGNSRCVNYFNVCGAILGFHLYAIGYVVGLAFASEPQPPKPAPPDGRDLERYFLGTTMDVDGFVGIVGVSNAAERAGLQNGDLILDVEHVEVDHSNLVSVMSTYTQRNSVEVGVLREGCQMRMTVTKD